MKWPTALICILALTCCNCLSAPPPTYDLGFGSGSTVFGQPAPVPANSVPNLAVDSEAQQRRIFPTTDFAYGFEENDFQTSAGTQSSLVWWMHAAGELLFGFIEENANRADTAGGRFINATVSAGQTFFIPQGLVHFGQNLQCTPAQFIATFPTGDPGTVTISLAFFNLPLSALRATLGLDDTTLQSIVNQVNSVQQVNPSFDTECLARCNIPVPKFTKENTFTQVAGSS
ncbi:TPA: hypothetical protein ACH3X1_014958 [Trebouxia sp. C0004]